MSANLELDLFKLRLLVGQRVECLVEDDKYVPGRIEQVGPDNCHVYSAILDDGSRVLCPVDEDLCIREYADEKEDYIFRLDVGSRVRCRVETGLVTGWSRGTVVRHLYRELDWPENKYVPYQVLLDDGELVWVPQDMAALVHAAGQKLRFRVGQTVICSVEGGWQQGIVIQIWPDDYLSAVRTYEPFKSHVTFV